MVLGEGAPYPRPDKFIGAMFSVPFQPGGIAYPVIEMDGAGGDGLHGTTGPNWDGRTVELDIIEHPTDDFVGSDSPGLEYAFTFKKTDRDDYVWTWFYETTSPFGVITLIPMLADDGNPATNVVVIKPDPQFMDVDWPPLGPAADWQWTPHGQCFVVPDPPDLENGAEFNGVDAYIELDHALSNTNAPMIFEADIKFNTIQENPFFGVGSTGGFGGFRDDHDFTWISLRPDPTFDATVGQWYKVRFEFEQRAQLSYDLFIDDVNVWAATQSRQHTAFNRLGVYKQGVSGTLWADLSMKNLKWWSGAAPSTDLILDMPLIDNALDLSDDENHGTTFNMDLPST
jgi:hypothetical protein